MQSCIDAGHFAPNVAYRVYEGNLNATKTGNGADVINLQGLAVGNGLTDPSIQYQYYAEMVRHQRLYES